MYPSFFYMQLQLSKKKMIQKTYEVFWGHKIGLSEKPNVSHYSLIIFPFSER